MGKGGQPPGKPTESDSVGPLCSTVVCVLLISAGIGSVLIAAGIGSVSAHTGLTLTGKGSAQIDGILTPGEWDAAGSVHFSANVPLNDGGGTTPAALFVMNDETNLFFALQIARTSFQGVVGLTIEFDNDHDGVWPEEGDDVFLTNAGTYWSPRLYDDYRTNQPPCPSDASWCGEYDVEGGGTNDGIAAASNNGTTTFIEISHPLDDTDDSHDFSLRTFDTVGFQMRLRLLAASPCIDFTQCLADTNLPIPAFGDIKVACLGSVIELDPNGGKVTVDSAEVSSVTRFCWAQSSSHVFQAESPIAVGQGSRLMFIAWNDGDTSNPRTFTVTGDANLTVTWRTQHYLTVISAHGSTRGEGWYDKGSLATFSLTRDIIDYNNGTRHVFTGWSWDSESQNLTASVTMSSPRTVQTNFVLQLFVTYQTTGCVLPLEPPANEWVNKGDPPTAMFSSVKEEMDLGTRCNFHSDDRPSSIISPTTVVAAYQTQFYLTVSSEFGSPSGEEWYDEGSSAQVSVESVVSRGKGERVVFNGWGGVSGGDTSSVTFTVDSPKSLTASWKTQYELAVSSSYASTTGSGWYDAGSNAQFSVQETRVSSGLLTYKVFQGWGGDFVGSSASASLTMDGPKKVVAVWGDDATQLLLLIGGVAAVAVVSIALVFLRKKR